VLKICKRFDQKDVSINGNTTVSSLLSATTQNKQTFTRRREKEKLRDKRIRGIPEMRVKVAAPNLRMVVSMIGKGIFRLNRICVINSRSGLVVKFVLAMHEPRVRFTAATFVLSFDLLSC
jgi:hypothetical protein